MKTLYVQGTREREFQDSNVRKSVISVSFFPHFIHHTEKSAPNSKPSMNSTPYVVDNAVYQSDVCSQPG